MNFSQRDLDQWMLRQWEKHFQDPEWDPVRGYRDTPGREEAEEQE